MAKWSKDWPGPVRPSARLAEGQDGQAGLPRRQDKPHAISDEMRWFIGGQQALMPELLAMVASTVNSYTRLIPGFWAPTDATWGVENRTCALRAIPGSREIAARRVPDRGGRHQSVYRARRRHRLGPLGHRAQDRARQADRGQRLCADSIPQKRAAAAHAVGRGAAAEGVEAGARTVRRRVRRPLRGDARMGGARVPQGDHRLGTGAVFRDHLMHAATLRANWNLSAPRDDASAPGRICRTCAQWPSEGGGHRRGRLLRHRSASSPASNPLLHRTPAVAMLAMRRRSSAGASLFRHQTKSGRGQRHRRRRRVPGRRP